jgi:uncharacterized protein involved in type VI secretion and phage assembly
MINWNVPEAAGAAGGAPRFYGMTIGLVTNNQDPEKLGRVKVRLPWLAADLESNWARVLAPMAGGKRGIFFLPEVDDEVLVAFEHGRLEFPYVLGGLWNGQDSPPADNTDGANNLRLIVSRSGHRIEFDDKNNGALTIVSEQGRRIRLDDAAGIIEIQSGENGSRIELNHEQGSLTIRSNRDLTIEAGSGKLSLRGTQIEIAASGNLKLQGAIIDLN